MQTQVHGIGDSWITQMIQAAQDDPLTIWDWISIIAYLVFMGFVFTVVVHDPCGWVTHEHLLRRDTDRPTNTNSARAPPHPHHYRRSKKPRKRKEQDRTGVQQDAAQNQEAGPSGNEAHATGEFFLQGDSGNDVVVPIAVQ
jgi:hypothetical protein